MIYLPMWHADVAASVETESKAFRVCWPAAAISKLFILLVNYVLRRPARSRERDKG